MTVHVYCVRLCVTVGVPLTECPERVTPVGSAWLSEYVSGLSPPVAVGSVNDDMGLFRVHDLSLIVSSPNVGVGSGVSVGVGVGAY